VEPWAPPRDPGTGWADTLFDCSVHREQSVSTGSRWPAELRHGGGSTRWDPWYHPDGRFAPEGTQSADEGVIGEDRLIDDLDDCGSFAPGYVQLKGPRSFESAHQRPLDHANGTDNVVPPANVHLVPKGSQAIAAHSRWRSGRILELGVIGEQGQPAILVTGIEGGLIALGSWRE
jgi:hypothetical protein